MHIGRKVSFFSSDGKVIYGIIFDKVNIPIASGSNEYTPMTYYLVLETDKGIDNDNIHFELNGWQKIHTVSPSNIKYAYFEGEVSGLEIKKEK